MRNPSAPAAAPRAVSRKVSGKSGAATSAKTARPSSQVAQHNGAGSGNGAQALTLSRGPSLLEGPSREAMIRCRAYERYERNGCADGHDLDDWLAAEAEVGAMLAAA